MVTKELKQFVNLRPEVTSDQYVCQEICGEYKLLPIKDKVVMDIGGNIGAFSVYAALHGATTVINYEPEESNFKQLLINTNPFSNVINNNAAITTADADTINFYLTNGLAKDGFSIIEFRGRKKVTVNNLNFYNELEKYKPQSIKMDVEGAEFSLLQTPLPHYVKDIVVEIHFSKKEFRHIFNNFIKVFDNWECVKLPKETGTNFHTLAQYTRK